MAEDIPKAKLVRVSSLNDLVRLAGTLASRMIVMPIYRLPVGGGHVYFLQMMYKDYYKYYGVPVIYYYCDPDDDRPPERARYVLAKTDESGERVEVSSRSRTGWLVVPLINVEEPPPFIDSGEIGEDSCKG